MSTDVNQTLNQTITYADDDFRKTFSEYLRAGYQCLFIPTVEEARLEVELQKIAQQVGRTFVTWDGAEGFNSPSAAQGNVYCDVGKALTAVAEDDANGPFSGDGIFLFKDLSDFFTAPMVRRIIRSICEGNRLSNQRHKRLLVISSPSDVIHDNLKSCMTVVDFKLPSEPMLRKVLDFVKASIGKQGSEGRTVDFSDELGDDIVGCLRGLTGVEAENVLSRCLVRHKGFEPIILDTIKEEKAGIVKKSEILTYIPETAQAPRDEIGGFDLLLDHMDRLRKAYGRKAREVNLDYPKGLVLLGVPGTGKSYVAMAMGQLLGLPVYILDIGAVFGHLVGQSESRMRQVLKQVEAQQGCVLLLDEADKAFGGATEGSQDSGVTRRVFGQFLTWLANKNDRTFVVMTLNRTTGIPPEFLRPGRFDSVFFTDLPHEEERLEILKIHFKKRGVELADLGMSEADWTSIISKTDGFVGSELEQVVKEARYLSFDDRESGLPTFTEITLAANGIKPISVLDAAGVRAIQDFGKGRAKAVTSEPKKQKKKRRQSQQRTRAVDVGDDPGIGNPADN